ncbi:MAG: hypothetical protein GX224_03870 [Thermoplasmatales archaeon]|nr:hypothetical protein [Thermoplasmatales archaeon]
MKAKHVIIAFVALALAIVPLASDDSEAAVYMGGDIVVNGGFTDMGGGSITVTVHNSATEGEQVTVGVFEMSSDRLLTSSTFVVPGNDGGTDGKAVKNIGLSYGSPGDKYVTVKLFKGPNVEGEFVSEQSGIMIHVTHSIWKDSTTYILIIVAIVAIAIILYVRSRGNPLSKTKKEEVSFADLNRERRERKRPSSTDRERYEGGRKGN